MKIDKWAKDSKSSIQLVDLQIAILYEDRSIIAIDKPCGWLLAPDSWTQTSRNLQLALRDSIERRDYWARSRGIRYLRYVHRLDSETTGVLLFARSPRVVESYSELFRRHLVEKVYLAVVQGRPHRSCWDCQAALRDDPNVVGRVVAVRSGGEAAVTRFRLVQSSNGVSLIEARPVTGRTHQIRVHLADAGLPILGDTLYGRPSEGGKRDRTMLALRAMAVNYRDPFDGRPIRIVAPVEQFLVSHGFRPDAWKLS